MTEQDPLQGRITTPIGAERLPFDEDLCGCVRSHTPRPHVVELHHVYPQGEQKKRLGRVAYKDTIPLCASGHDNVHVAINAMLRGERFRLGNWRLQAIAVRGVDSIYSGSLMPEEAKPY